MVQINLIVPANGTLCEPDWVASIVSELTSDDQSVDVIDVETSVSGTTLQGDGLKRVRSPSPGLAAAAVAGLDASTGDILVVVDPAYGYSATDVANAVQPLLRGEAELVVGSRYSKDTSGLRRVAGSLARLVVGTSDPLSGLVAVTRPAFDHARAGFLAVGRSFTMELVTRVTGRKTESEVRSVAAWRKPNLSWDDLRHVKRLADHRYGTFSRLVQFCSVGASGMIVDLTLYALFQRLFGNTILESMVVPPTKIRLSMAMAGVLAIFVALCWNFFLNRRFTFADSRGHSSVFRQFTTYTLSNFLSILVSLALRLGLPRRVEFFSHHKLTAAVIGIVVGTAISFTMARWLVFRQAISPSQLKN